jgi:hypothetical protein
MSDETHQFDIRAQLARIDRDLAEAAKFNEERGKLLAEARELNAEARKIDRDRWRAPLAVAATAGGLLGVASFIARLMGGR